MSVQPITNSQNAANSFDVQQAGAQKTKGSGSDSTAPSADDSTASNSSSQSTQNSTAQDYSSMSLSQLETLASSGDPQAQSELAQRQAASNQSSDSSNGKKAIAIA